MLMSRIYVELEEHYKSAAEMADELMKEMNEIDNKILELTAQRTDAELKYKRAANNRDSIKMSLDSLSELDGDYSVSEEEIKEAEEEEKKEEFQEGKKLEWKHKTAVLLKYGKDNTLLGRYMTQKELANQLKCSPQKVGYIIKLDKEKSIKKYGFYLKYEY